VGKKKPIALILHSPFDRQDSHVDYNSTAGVLDDLGYGVINKVQLTWNTDPQKLVF
jgi:hypothetical protein